MVPGNEVLYPLGNTGYAVPPGETLRELLDERGLTQRDLARRADLSPKHVNRSDDVIDSGNTIAATIPIALGKLAENGSLPSGKFVLLFGFDDGLAYAGQLIRL